MPGINLFNIIKPKKGPTKGILLKGVFILQLLINPLATTTSCTF